MGGSASSQLDESKCAYIRGKTEAVISNFGPHYRRQYAVALLQQIRREVEQHRDPQARFLKSKPLSEQETVLYGSEVFLYAEDLKKWKERYVVIKKDYAVECYENKEAYQKGVSPKNKILPTGGKVLTSEEEYNALSDKQFPDPIASSEKETSQPFIVVPSTFPVYLWHPYTRHGFFCFQDAESQKCFSTVLDDCVRHQNHDFLKQTTIEALAFSEAIQFFRQEKGQYGSWEMIMGTENQILTNLVMEELLPSLQTDLLPKMKGKRNDRKRTWFATVEETYNLVLGQVSEGFQFLLDDCRNQAKQLEGTIRSDMDQIVTSQEFLAGKIKATVMEPADKCCLENVQPFLASVLEELMGPVSSGFSEVRQVFEKEVDAISQSFQAENDLEKLKVRLEQLAKLPTDSVKMEPCYLKVNLLREQLQDLKSRFKFYHTDLVVQRAQNDMQELMENTVYTFDQLLSHASKGDPQKMSTAIEKVKLRVLKQYDYDSSTIRKRIFQEALILITMPTLQRTLASTCKPELQTFEQFIFADHTNVIQVENIYEEILFGKLLDETNKVIQEAASLKKHDLYEDNERLTSESVSSLTDLKTPSGSAQASPEKTQETVGEHPIDIGGESNDVFIESSSAGLQESKAGTLTGDAVNSPSEEQLPSAPLKTVLAEDPTSEEGHLPKVEKITIANITDKQESPVLSVQQKNLFMAEETSLEKPSTEGAGQKEVQLQKVVLDDVAVDNVHEIRNLLTVTIEVPTEVQHQNIEEMIDEGRIIQIEERIEKVVVVEEKEDIGESKVEEALIEQTKHCKIIEETRSEVSVEAEKAHSEAVQEGVSKVIQLAEAEVTREENLQVDCGKDKEGGQAAESVESDKCGGSQSPKIQIDECVDHIQAVSKVELETSPVQAVFNEDSIDQVVENIKTQDITTGSVDVTGLEEGQAVHVSEELPEEKPLVDAAPEALVDAAPEALVDAAPEALVDAAPEALVDTPNDDSKHIEQSANLEIPNCPESVTQETSCTEHAGESSVTE